MKKGIVLLILVILLAAASGCTQTPAPTTPATTATPASPMEVTPIITTPEPATVLPTTVSATVTATVVASGITTAATIRPDMAPSTKITTIHIRNNTFVPDQLTVLPGTGITWINDDPVTHVVKGIGNSTGKFTSSEMVRGAQFGYTFGEATGTFEFGDPAYPAMKGAIIVKQGDAVVGGSPQISSSNP